MYLTGFVLYAVPAFCRLCIWEMDLLLILFWLLHLLYRYVSSSTLRWYGAQSIAAWLDKQCRRLICKSQHPVSCDLHELVITSWHEPTPGSMMCAVNMGNMLPPPPHFQLSLCHPSLYLISLGDGDSVHGWYMSIGATHQGGFFCQVTNAYIRPND